MNTWEKLQNIDVRIIYLVLVVMVAIPLIKPMGLPIEISKETQMAYDAIEALPEGSIIIMDAAYSPSASTELGPANLAMARHCFSKNVRIIGFNSWELGGHYMKTYLDQAAEDFGKVYGEDYICLGYKIPLGATIRAAINDTWAAWKADVNGTSFSQLPLMDEFRSIKEDCHMVVVYNSGSPGAGNWVTYVGTPSLNPGPRNPDGFVRTIPINVACTSVEVPGSKTSLQAGIYTGLLAGGRGAAEYELLINYPDQGIASMDAQSMGHLAIIAFIILGNVGYIGSRRAS